MNKFIILYNDKYEGVAKVCQESLAMFSQNPCVAINLGHNGCDHHQFSTLKTQWLVDNLHTFDGDSCYLDADMVATPRVDELWSYSSEKMFPVFSAHPHQPASKRYTSLVKIPIDDTYHYGAPSIWPNTAKWFARAMLAIMAGGVYGEEVAINLILWACGITYRMPVAMTESNDPAKWNTGWFFHGEKDWKRAEAILKKIPNQ